MAKPLVSLNMYMPEILKYGYGMENSVIRLSVPDKKNKKRINLYIKLDKKSLLSGNGFDVSEIYFKK
jgi:hypothetical protein